METIKRIIKQLDVVLAQVLIEGVIVEVGLDDQKQFGVSYLQHPIPGTDANNFGAGALNNNTFLSPNSYVGSITTNAGNGLIPSGFSYFARINSDLDVAVTALASGTKAKILQRPRIQTSHGVQATLFVGESRPYPVSSYYGGGAYGGYASIQQLQIGVTLEVTPLINTEGLVVMDIHQKIDSFKGNVVIQNVGEVPITSEKDATAKVAVRDHETVVLGGLIEDTKTSNNSGVPYLKDIPLLGAIFRSSSSDATRSELIIFIRPTVLPTPEAAAIAAKAEEHKMPAVRRLESEVQKDEAKRLRQANQDLQDY
jgi:general secretion pathway protein D